MIYFYSDNNKTVKKSKVIILKTSKDLTLIDEFLADLLVEGEEHYGKTLLGYDLETTGLDAYMHSPLLIILGNKEHQFIIDCTDKFITAYVTDLLIEYKEDFCILGHNLKFDYKMSKQHWEFDFKTIYDTMLVEQRTTQNIKMSSRLDLVLMRRLKCKPDAMDKDVRMQFVGGNLNKFRFTNDQIEYAAGDIAPLFDLRHEQWKRVEKYGMEFLLNSISFPLSRVLGLAELRGYVFNVPKWTENIVKNKEIVYETQCNLDKEVRRLRDFLLKNKDERLYMVGGEFDRVRNKPVSQVNVGLFGEPVTLKALTGVANKPKQNVGNINYGSSTQIVKIFGRLGQKLPTKKSNTAVPTIDKKGKVTKRISGDEFTTNSNELAAFLITNFDTPMKEFLSLLSTFKTAQTEINNFGQNYIDKINPVTGKIHTIYGQCFTANGRLNSGGGKNQPDKFNNQNIPAKIDMRHCFGTEVGYKVVTCDLSGAEVTVMASKAQDERLLELSGNDIHSHMAIKGWRAIFLQRYKELKIRWDTGDIAHSKENREHVLDVMNKAKNFNVSKKENNKSHRGPGKALTFGSVYGCHSKKAGKSLNVSKDEGGIYINSIKKEIPSTFRMVESNVRLALKQGFLILNTRTNSRVWFDKVIDAKKYHYELDFMDKVAIDGQARNLPISGTQADMLKEAMVEIQNDIDKNGWDCNMLGQVHDELIYDFKDTEKYAFFPKYVSDKMCEVSNRYLDGFKMGADYDVELTWTK